MQLRPHPPVSAADPYAILEFDSQKYQSKVEKKTLKPKWRETFRFQLGAYPKTRYEQKQSSNDPCIFSCTLVLPRSAGGPILWSSTFHTSLSADPIPLCRNPSVLSSVTFYISKSNTQIRGLLFLFLCQFGRRQGKESFSLEESAQEKCAKAIAGAKGQERQPSQWRTPRFCNHKYYKYVQQHDGD